MHLISQAEVVELNQRLISLASSSVVESLEMDEFLQIFVRRLYSYIPPILKADLSEPSVETAIEWVIRSKELSLAHFLSPKIKEIQEEVETKEMIEVLKQLVNLFYDITETEQQFFFSFKDELKPFLWTLNAQEREQYILLFQQLTNRPSKIICLRKS